MSNGNLVETVALMGVPISNVTMDEAIEYIDDSIRRGGFHQFATANVDFVKNAIDDPEMQQILFDCDLVVPDGMPLLWVSRLLNCPLRERVCGVDMVPRLAELAPFAEATGFFFSVLRNRCLGRQRRTCRRSIPTSRSAVATRHR